MQWLIWPVLGAIVGLLIHNVNPIPSSGWLLDVVVGVIGAFIGGFLFDVIRDGNEPTLWSALLAVVGAMCLTGLLRMLSVREG